MKHTQHNSTFVLALALALAGCSGASNDRETTLVVPAPAVHTWTSGEAGFFTHSHWLDTGKEVVVFDAQFTPAAAESMLAEIRTATDSPIRYVVVTHPNPDKFNGASVFQNVGAKVVASRATAEAIPGVHDYKKYYFVNVAKSFTEENYPERAAIDIVFDDSLELDLAGNSSVALQVLENPGVSSTQTVAWLASQQALIVGDLIHPKVHAWLEGGIVVKDGQGVPQPNLATWRSALDELVNFGSATVFSGRGKAADLSSAIVEQKRYLGGVEDIVATWLADAKAGTVDVGDTDGLSTRVHDAFPEYDMKFMTNYSIYGLVQQ